jgi:hypothetical protein
MNSPLPQTDSAERLESLKAGIAGAIVIATSLILLRGIDAATGGFISVGPLARTMPEFEYVVAHPVWISGAIGFLSGFVFGVTYRYIVRHDRNPQLKAGAIMAFGLVRGLAQVELSLSDSLWGMGSRVLQSLVLFAVAGLALEWAMQQGWIKAFGTASE